MPSSIIEKLLKILKLEIELGCENKAVVGGLEKYVPTWVNEAQTANIDGKIVKEVTNRLNEYRQLTPEKRPGEIKLIQDLVRSAAATYRPSPRPGKPPVQQPSATRFPPAVPTEGRPPQQSTTNRPPQNIPQVKIPPSPTQITQPIEAKNQPALGLNAPLTVLHGIGPKNAELLETINLRTLEDLLYYFPRRYDDYSQLKTINHLQFGEELTIIGSIQSIANRPVRGGQLQITEALITDGTGFLRV